MWCRGCRRDSICVVMWGDYGVALWCFISNLWMVIILIVADEYGSLMQFLYVKNSFTFKEKRDFIWNFRKIDVILHPLIVDSVYKKGVTT